MIDRDEPTGAAAMKAGNGAWPPLPEVLGTHVGFLIDRAARICSTIFTDELASTGLSIRAAGILLVLAEAGAASQLSVAQMMRLERSTASSAADELEQAGLIRRRRDPADRRLNELTLTRRGRALVPEIREASDGTEKRLLAGLPPTDRATLEAVLGRIVATADTVADDNH